MQEPARVVLGVEAQDLAEEVMHFLDRTGRARVVGTASDERQLAEAIRQLEPDAVVASPELAVAAGGPNGCVLLALDTAETISSLRSAIRAGARGYFLWPGDRQELAGAAARATPRPVDSGAKRALVVAILGARGGAGSTFIATHLASSFARRKRSTILVDLDLEYADLSPTLGVPAGERLRTLVDAVPVARELSAEQVDELLWTHPHGFRVLLAPGDPLAASSARGPEVSEVVEAMRRSADVVALHVPRTLDEVRLTGLGSADVILVVLTQDVLSFRDAKRASELLSAAGLGQRCEFVVNRATRAEISPMDVERVFGRRPAGVIPSDRRVPRAQDRGRLLPGRGRTARSLDRLAGRVLEANR